MQPRRHLPAQRRAAGGRGACASCWCGSGWAPLTGGDAYLVSVFVSALTVVPIVILAICVVGAYRPNQGGAPFLATIVLGIGYASVHWLAIRAGGPPLIGFLSLLLGVATWTWALRTPASRAPAPSAPAAA